LRKRLWQLAGGRRWRRMRADPALQGTANHRAGNSQTGRRSGQFLVEQIFDCGQDARGDGVLRPTGLTCELGRPLRGLLPRRLASSGDKLPRCGDYIVIMDFHHVGTASNSPILPKLALPDNLPARSLCRLTTRNCRYSLAWPARKKSRRT